MTLLDSIHDPADLRRLSIPELPRVAQEIRDLLIQSVAKTGGHIGAGLGVVELTIALHYVLNTPEDRIVWDVGHQAYPHKVLTGRKDLMHTLRQYKGISGFTKRTESPYDPFGTGHSSTSISAALGMQVGAFQEGQHRVTAAVIGDGAMGAGMAFEALNHAGHVRRPLLVVLNDNEMSISPNVGALSSYLSRIISGGLYNKVRHKAERMLKGSPVLYEVAKRAEEHVKGMITPGTLFEELGFNYVGPIDGHDFEALIPTLRNCVALGEPVLLHVVTKKGKGYAPAEEHPHTYHGVGPYKVETGEIIKSPNQPPSYTKVFAQTLVGLAEQDERIMAITAAMPEGTGLNLFQQAHPERFFDVGIAEQHAVTFAAGAACEGAKPVVAIYSTFLQRGYDQIVHDVCIQNLPVLFAVDRAGVVGADGATHTGAFDITFLRSIPQMAVLAPADEDELRHMVATALNHDGPCALRFPRGNGLGVPMQGDPEILPWGKGKLLREGDTGTLFAFGATVAPAVEAARTLAAEGINLAVVNLRFAKPLDEALILEWAGKTGRVMVVEENAIQGGVGSAVLELLSQRDALVPTKLLGFPDQFLPQGSQGEVRAELGIDAAGIATAARLFFAPKA